MKERQPDERRNNLAKKALGCTADAAQLLSEVLGGYREPLRARAVDAMVASLKNSIELMGRSGVLTDEKTQKGAMESALFEGLNSLVTAPREL